MGKDDWSLFEGFTTDFWNLINSGESVFKIIREDGSICETSLKNWEDFYEYYTSN